VVLLEINRAIAGSRFVALEQSGHFPFVEESELFLQAVESYFWWLKAMPQIVLLAEASVCQVAPPSVEARMMPPESLLPTASRGRRQQTRGR
jgi:hypothetical protein